MTDDVSFDIKLGTYVTATCCSDCAHAHDPVVTQFGVMPIPPVCPKCGGEWTEEVGRWAYTERKRWWGLWTEYNMCGFVRGRNND